MAAISTLPLTFAMIGVSSDPAMAENGVGPSALANAIDQKIEQFHSNEDIVGMTVAITKNGESSMKRLECFSSLLICLLTARPLAWP